MSVKQWMVAGVLALAGVGSAAATDFDAHDVAAGSRNAAESSSREAGGVTGGDLLGIGRDTSSSRRSGETDSDNGNAGHNHNSGTAGGSEHGGRISAPTSARPATLGWQSLLPGSIQ